MGGHKAEDIVGTTEAAKSLGVTPRRVVQLIDDGVIPATAAPVGVGWMIRFGDLERARGRTTARGPKPKKRN